MIVTNSRNWLAVVAFEATGYSDTDWNWELLFLVVDSAAVLSLFYGIRCEHAAFMQPFVVLSVRLYIYCLSIDCEAIHILNLHTMGHGKQNKWPRTKLHWNPATVLSYMSCCASCWSHWLKAKKMKINQYLKKTTTCTGKQCVNFEGEILTDSKHIKLRKFKKGF